MTYIQIFTAILKDYCIKNKLVLGTEYRFHRACPGEKQRQWKFDYILIRNGEPIGVAFEYDGGTYLRKEITTKKGKKIITTGRHTTAEGFAKDCEKLNYATLQGWKVYRFTATHLKKHEMNKTLELLNKIFEEAMMAITYGYVSESGMLDDKNAYIKVIDAPTSYFFFVLPGIFKIGDKVKIEITKQEASNG